MINEGVNVLVRLERDWTDPTGAAHAAGDLVEVDAVTLAELTATGVVVEAKAGSGGGGSAGADAQWAGPTGDGGAAT